MSFVWESDLPGVSVPDENGLPSDDVDQILNYAWFRVFFM